jgi:hypothetical protein
MVVARPSGCCQRAWLPFWRVRTNPSLSAVRVWPTTSPRLVLGEEGEILAPANEVRVGEGVAHQPLPWLWRKPKPSKTVARSCGLCFIRAINPMALL